jgi:hypothetical protein
MMQVKIIKVPTSYHFYEVGQIVEVEYREKNWYSEIPYYYSELYGIIYTDCCVTLNELRKEKLNRILNDE